MKLHFHKSRNSLDEQYKKTEWLCGETEDELRKRIALIERKYPSKALAKAKTLEAIVENGSIAVDKYDIFQEKLRGFSLMLEQRERWEKAIINKHLSSEAEEIAQAIECGAYCANSDFGHVSPNTALMLNVGLAGLRSRCRDYSLREGITDEQRDFYLSCDIVLGAIERLAERLSEAVASYNTDCATALSNISKDKPQNIYEAMQLIILYFFSHEYVAGTRVRTLGRLDSLLYPFYLRDLESGRFTEDEIKELFRYFLNKFSSADIPYGLPFCLGGLDPDGNEVTNELSRLIVEVYDELDIYSPKIHIRVSKKTPRDFIKQVLSCIRRGRSSFVFVSDETAIRALTRVGIDKRDALNYVPIGCYEPAVWGVEIGCTGNGYVSLPKALELAMNGGCDGLSNYKCGCDTEKAKSFNGLLGEVKRQIAYMTDRALDYVTKIERYYPEINPDAILSCQYDAAVESGRDVYSGGAKYNNSSMYFYSIASLTDSLLAVKKLVYDEERITLSALNEILKNNWEGEHLLRAEILRYRKRYGNGDAEADSLASELAEYCASLVNGRRNGRGGVFKASLFSINNCFATGKRTMASADGRLSGEPLSKNLCAVTAMDRSGITALIRSVTEIDHSAFPNGSVLDIVLHPSAVEGEEGLAAFLALLETYIARGGFALHGNVFTAEELKAAQLLPEKYKNLQVRVCGWNARFVDLNTDEQNEFIRQAEER